MCPHSQWEKVSKGSWSGSMSPYEHKLVEIRTAASSLDIFEVALEEGYFLVSHAYTVTLTFSSWFTNLCFCFAEFYISRLVFFISGVILMSLAPSLSNSLVFYYGSGMAIGVVLVILIVLFQVI